MKTTGTVKFFNEQKGFGFIAAAEGDDVFVHISNIEAGSTLTEGTSVEYETAPGRKGPEAINVRVV
jgi:cold shock protein